MTGKVDRNQLERLERAIAGVEELLANAELEDHVHELLTELQDVAITVLDGFDDYERKEER